MKEKKKQQKKNLSSYSPVFPSSSFPGRHSRGNERVFVPFRVITAASKSLPRLPTRISFFCFPFNDNNVDDHLQSFVLLFLLLLLLFFRESIDSHRSTNIVGLPVVDLHFGGRSGATEFTKQPTTTTNVLFLFFHSKQKKCKRKALPMQNNARAAPARKKRLRRNNNFCYFFPPFSVIKKILFLNFFQKRTKTTEKKHKTNKQQKTLKQRGEYDDKKTADV